MSKTITLRDTNHGFRRCIRELAAGEITRNGKPVAKSPRQARSVARGRARSDAGTNRKRLGLGNKHLNQDDLYDEIIASNI